MSVHADVKNYGGATFTEWCDLPDDGGWHPSISRFMCDLAGEEDIKATSHMFRRAAWLVEFDDDRVTPIVVCYWCAQHLFGVVKS